MSDEIEDTRQQFERRIDSALAPYDDFLKDPYGYFLRILSYSRETKRPPQRIAISELVETMLAVHAPQIVRLLSKKKSVTEKGKKKSIDKWRQKTVGLSIARLARENHWHRNKASRCLIILKELGLIELVGNYGAGHRGNVYRIVEQGAEPLSMPTTQQSPPPTKIVVNDGMADPW